MPLSCADEVYSYLGGAFDAALHDPALAHQVELSRLRVRLGFVDPDCVIYLDTGTHDVRLGGAGAACPSLIVAMAAETANRYWQGRCDLEPGIANGDIAALGDQWSLNALEALRAVLVDPYIAQLRSAGRVDLIVS